MQDEEELDWAQKRAIKQLEIQELERAQNKTTKH